jgi:hypothetical protein
MPQAFCYIRMQVNFPPRSTGFEVSHDSMQKTVRDDMPLTEVDTANSGKLDSA